MTTQSLQTVKKQNRNNRNIIETLETDKQKSDILEQFFGPRNLEGFQKKETKPRVPKQEFKLFDKAEYQERENTTSQIKELLNQINQEVKAIKSADSALLGKIQDAEKIAIENITENQGAYNIRFLELIVSYLRTVKQKIGESSTWFDALKTKAKKRGSLLQTYQRKKELNIRFHKKFNLQDLYNNYSK